LGASVFSMSRNTDRDREPLSVSGRSATIEHLNFVTLLALPDDAPVTMLNLMRFRSAPPPNLVALAGRHHRAELGAYLAAGALHPFPVVRP